MQLSLKAGISFTQIIWHARTTCLVNFSVDFTSWVYTHFPEECKFSSLKQLLLLMSEITIALHSLMYHSNHKVIKKCIADSDLIKSVFKNFSLCEKSFIKSFFSTCAVLVLFFKTWEYKMLIKTEAEITVLMAISIFILAQLASYQQ